MMPHGDISTSGEQEISVEEVPEKVPLRLTLSSDSETDIDKPPKISRPKGARQSDVSAKSKCRISQHLVEGENDETSDDHRSMSLLQFTSKKMFRVPERRSSGMKNAPEPAVFSKKKSVAEMSESSSESESGAGTSVKRLAMKQAKGVVQGKATPNSFKAGKTPIGESSSSESESDDNTVVKRPAVQLTKQSSFKSASAMTAALRKKPAADMSSSESESDSELETAAKNPIVKQEKVNGRSSESESEAETSVKMPFIKQEPPSTSSGEEEEEEEPPERKPCISHQHVAAAAEEQVVEVPAPTLEKIVYEKLRPVEKAFMSQQTLPLNLSPESRVWLVQIPKSLSEESLLGQRLPLDIKEGIQVVGSNENQLRVHAESVTFDSLFCIHSTGSQAKICPLEPCGSVSVVKAYKLPTFEVEEERPWAEPAMPIPIAELLMNKTSLSRLDFSPARKPLKEEAQIESDSSPAKKKKKKKKDKHNRNSREGQDTILNPVENVKKRKRVSDDEALSPPRKHPKKHERSSLEMGTSMDSAMEESKEGKKKKKKKHADEPRGVADSFEESTDSVQGGGKKKKKENAVLGAGLLVGGINIKQEPSSSGESIKYNLEVESEENHLGGVWKKKKKKKKEKEVSGEEGYVNNSRVSEKTTEEQHSTAVGSKKKKKHKPEESLMVIVKPEPEDHVEHHKKKKKKKKHKDSENE